MDRAIVAEILPLPDEKSMGAANPQVLSFRSTRFEPSCHNTARCFSVFSWEVDAVLLADGTERVKRKLSNAIHETTSECITR